MLGRHFGDGLAAARRISLHYVFDPVIQDRTTSGFQLFAGDVANVVILFDFKHVALAVAGKNAALGVELVRPNLDATSNGNAPLCAVTCLRLDNAHFNRILRYGGCGAVCSRNSQRGETCKRRHCTAQNTR